MDRLLVYGDAELRQWALDLVAPHPLLPLPLASSSYCSMRTLTAIKQDSICVSNELIDCYLILPLWCTSTPEGWTFRMKEMPRLSGLCRKCLSESSLSKNLCRSSRHSPRSLRLSDHRNLRASNRLSFWYQFLDFSYSFEVEEHLPTSISQYRNFQNFV